MALVDGSNVTYSEVKGTKEGVAQQSERWLATFLIGALSSTVVFSHAVGWTGASNGISYVMVLENGGGSLL